MVDIQPVGFSMGTIFTYPESITENELSSWVQESDFSDADMPDIPPNADINVPRSIESGFGLLINEDAEIDNIGDVSFVTIKDEQQAREEQVKQYVESLWEEIERIGLEQEILTLETVIEFKIRVSSDFDLSKCFTDAFSQTVSSEFQGNDAQIKANHVEVQSDLDGDESGWYQIQIDSNASKNPNIWKAKLLSRSDSYEEVNGEELINKLERIIDYTGD